MSRFSPGFLHSNAVAANKLVSSFIGSQTLNASATVQTFNNGGSGFDAGTADPNCWIVVALYVGTAVRDASGVTFGGQAMTFLNKVSVGTGRLVEFWYTNFTGGGAQNVVATYNIGSSNGSVGVYKLVGPLDTAGITFDSVQGVQSYNPTLTVPKSGSCGIAVAITSSANAITFTEPAAADYATNDTATTAYRFAGGHHDNLAAGTWSPNMSIGAGSAAFAGTLFPPL